MSETYYPVLPTLASPKFRLAVEDWVEEVCDDLCIPKPVIKYTNDKLMTDTMLATCSGDGKSILIKVVSDNDKVSLDLYFTIAHELRHAWQILKHKTEYMSQYKSVVDLKEDLEAYNSQKAEIDANAYGVIMMVDCFNRKPILPLSKNILRLIEERRKTIDDELDAEQNMM